MQIDINYKLITHSSTETTAIPLDKVIMPTIFRSCRAIDPIHQALDHEHEVLDFKQSRVS